jgi:hypothetical protein
MFVHRYSVQIVDLGNVHQRINHLDEQTGAGSSRWISALYLCLSRKVASNTRQPIWKNPKHITRDMLDELKELDTQLLGMYQHPSQYEHAIFDTQISLGKLEHWQSSIPC